MLKSFTYRLLLLAAMLCFVGGTAVLYAYEAEEQGYTEEEYDQEDDAAFIEEQAPADEALDKEEMEEAYAEENYVEEGYVEEEQDNNQAPSWEGPIPFEPAYTGKENIRIERSTRPKRKKQTVQTPDTPETAEQQSRENKADKEKHATVIQRECNPVVRVSANKEKRFDILKKLADEHGFEIVMLEAENHPISLEKNEVLSRVIESITRDMSVVLNYQKANGCERLVAISVLDNSEWSGAGNSRSRASSNSNALAIVKQYSPGANSLSPSRNRETDTSQSSPASYNTPASTYQSREAKKQELQELREERRKARELRSMNQESPGGKRQKNDSYENDDWKNQGEQIDNMEMYVDEVMSGERVPNIRGMTIQQRTEYMRLRREHKQQKQQ